MIDLTKAKQICAETAAHRIRWGRHAGVPPSVNDTQLLDALVALHDSGVLSLEPEQDDLRSDLILSNRQKGMAEARAKKYKGQLDAANKRIKELTIALDDCENGAL